MTKVEQEVEQAVREFIATLTSIVEHAAMGAITEALGRTTAAVGKGAAKPSRTRTQTRAAAPPAAKKGRGRPSQRSPEQISETLDRIVAYIEKNPNVRSQTVRTELKLPKPVALDALKRLRDAKRIKLKGTKNAATYSVA